MFIYKGTKARHRSLDTETCFVCWLFFPAISRGIIVHFYWNSALRNYQNNILITGLRGLQFMHRDLFPSIMCLADEPFRSPRQLSGSAQSLRDSFLDRARTTWRLLCPSVLGSIFDQKGTIHRSLQVNSPVTFLAGKPEQRGADD